MHPLYSAASENNPGQPSLFYTLRRLPRRRSAEESRHGSPSDYTGTDMFISLSEPAGIDDDAAVAEISIRAVCSNRHLPEHLPVGASGADFRLTDNMALDIRCVAGPTPPRGPVVGELRSRSETSHAGAVTWRLINMLSLNYLGLVERGAGEAGQSVRDVLTLSDSDAISSSRPPSSAAFALSSSDESSSIGSRMFAR